jgi:hypothetical protein
VCGQFLDFARIRIVLAAQAHHEVPLKQIVEVTQQRAGSSAAGTASVGTFLPGATTSGVSKRMTKKEVFCQNTVF